MAWTSPKTWVAGATLTASDLNTHIRDNLLETAPAKATETGALIVSSGVNEVAERVVRSAYISTSQTTTSTSFTDLSTAGPSVTTTTGTTALAIWGCRVDNSGASSLSVMSCAVTGSTAVGASDSRYFGGSAFVTGTMAVFYSALTPGSHTFTCKYRVTGGTGTFERRRLTVIPF